MCKIFDPLMASNNFVERGFSEGYEISPMKVQKLLYFLYRDYLRETGDPLFSERFETWQYGPVLSCVYHAFKNYGSGSIKRYYISTDGKAHKISEKTNPVFGAVIGAVWDKYKSFTGMELSELTHKPHTAWYTAWINDDVFLNDVAILAEANHE